MIDQVYVRTLSGGETVFASAQLGAGGQKVPGDGDSSFPAFSPDGTKLAFHSMAHNLAGGSTQVSGLYMTELASGLLRRLSTKAADAAGTTVDANADSLYPRFLPDGLGLAYLSGADNLVAGDTNGAHDIFVATLSPPLPGNDFIQADGGNDVIFGGPGDDGILGEDGDDAIFGGLGDDTIIGGPGDDAAIYPEVRRRYKVQPADQGTFIVYDLLGAEGYDSVQTSTEMLVFYDMSGTLAEMADPALDNKPPVATGVVPTLSVAAGIPSPDTAVPVGPDADGDPLTVSLAVAPARGTVTILPGGAGFRYTANLSATVPSDSFTLKVADTYDNDAFPAHVLVPVTVKIALRWTGGNGNDKQQGGDDADVLSGGGGNDTLVGGGGDDVLKGGIGADQLAGGLGADRLEGGSGNDKLDGGTGADVMLGGTGDDTYTVDDKADLVTEGAKQGYDTVMATVSYSMPAHVEMLVLKGSAKLAATGNPANTEAETFVGNAADNVLNGLGGEDIFVDSGGRDTIRGGQGADWLSYIGATRGVVVDLGTAATGGNVLSSIENVIGSVYADRLTGNTAANVLTGGKGRDTLTGKGGKDTFRFASVSDSPASAPDTITDFRAKAGDRIDLRTFTTKSGTVQLLTFIGTGKFSRRKGEVRFVPGALLVDVTGDAKADFKLRLTGLKTMRKSALLLR